MHRRWRRREKEGWRGQRASDRIAGGARASATREEQARALLARADRSVRTHTVLAWTDRSVRTYMVLAWTDRSECPYLHGSCCMVDATWFRKRGVSDKTTVYPRRSNLTYAHRR